MKTLKELIAYQEITGESDMEIIYQYFTENDCEQDGVELSYKLAKAKIEKMTIRNNIIKTWAYSIPSEYLYATYDLKTATKLHDIELDYIVNGEVTNKRLEWAKENIPNIEMPKVYFMPCADWLADQGIEFKNYVR